MSRVGRNDPCPCGSGAKYKRCCLGAEDIARRGLGAAKSALARLSELAWEHYREACEAGFERHYEGGLPAFGMLGPSEEELRRAEAWFLLDRRLSVGATPLDCLAERLPAGPGIELLVSSELRLWRLGGAAGPGTVAGSCPLTGEQVALVVEAAAGEPVRPGGLADARTLPIADGLVALLAPTDVDPDVADELVEWARAAWRSVPDGQGFWRAFGGGLSRAASAWPEERVHTREGELVRSSLASWSVSDAERAAELLGADAELEERPQEELDDPGEPSWVWRRETTTPTPVTMAPRPGIRWRLDDDDDEAGERPSVAQLDLGPWEKRLWLFASTPERLRAAEQRAASALGDVLGSRRDHDVDPPYVTPRWERRRLDSWLGELGAWPGELTPSCAGGDPSERLAA